MRNRSTVVFIFGLILLGLNIYGLGGGVRHPDLVAFDNGQAAPHSMAEISYQRLIEKSSYGLRISRRQALDHYRNALGIEDEEMRIRRIRAIVTESTVHYYPITTRETEFLISIQENFILWGLSWLSPVLERLGFATLTPYEFLDGEKA